MSRILVDPFIESQLDNVVIAGGQRPAECAFHYQ